MESDMNGKLWNNAELNTHLLNMGGLELSQGRNLFLRLMLPLLLHFVCILSHTTWLWKKDILFKNQD